MTVARAAIEGLVEISAIPSIFSASTVWASKVLSVSAIILEASIMVNGIKVLRSMETLSNFGYISFKVETSQ
jgi:hypothetical protein